MPRVVITGVGLETGLGATAGLTWSRLCAGEHAFREVPGTAGPGGRPEAGAWSRDDDRVGRLGADVARQALADAGLLASGYDGDRVGVCFGLSKGDVRALAGAQVRLAAGQEVRHFADAWPHAGSTRVATEFGLRGPCLAPVAACATGLIAALRGADLIRRGLCDVVVAGAADASLTPFLLGAFRKLGVLARVAEGSDPGRAVRPWDRNRTGFLVGEGAAALVLERDGHARARGALPYAEFCGGAYGADAYHETNLDPDPTHLAGLIGRALRDAGVSPAEVDHVNVHGTATRANDPLECRALRLAFGPHAGRLACSANKPQVGHLLGAAGAAELAFSALAVRDGFVPPTLNLDDPDPLCDLDGTPHAGRAVPIRAALKLSIGFGGHLAAAVLRRAEGPVRRGAAP